jgi:hypothetical protein
MNNIPILTFTRAARAASHALIAAQRDTRPHRHS